MTIQELAEMYRQQLGLLPWEEWEKSREKQIDECDSLTVEMKQREKVDKRQYGRTTRGLLLAIAEAVLTKRPLLINAPSKIYIGTLTYRAKDLVEKLGLTVKVLKSERSVVAFTDHRQPSLMNYEV